MMEIDFLIQWKNKVTDKTNLALKIKEMLTQLFRDVKSSKFYFDSDDGNSYEFDYKHSERNEKVYLKISCNYSEAKSAKLLSSIRDVICNGKHRKDFLIICTYDEASLSYCCRLMKPFGIFERHLRELMYLITVKAFGADWVNKTFPEETIADIKEKSHGIENEKLTETALELLDYSEISAYLFDERYFEYTAEQILENKLSDELLETLSKNEIISIISNSRKDTLWNKLFSNNQKIQNINKDTIEAIRRYRNDIMHHHTLNEKKYKEMQTVVKQVDKSVILAIKDIENKIYTENEYISVFSTMNNVLYEAIRAFNNAMKINIPDISASLDMTLKNLSEIGKSISDAYSQNLSSAIHRMCNPIANLSFPDYSKLFETHKYSSEISETPLLDDLSSDKSELQEILEDDNDNQSE